MSNILEQANNIINNRSEEKERQYGPMGEGFERAAMMLFACSSMLDIDYLHNFVGV